MLARRPGSGTSTVSANATAEYLAAALSARDAEAATFLQQITQHEAAQHRVVTSNPQAACARALALLRTTFPQVSAARAVGTGHAGDLIITAGGMDHHCEVKAQYGKRNFADLTQADWVRDATDALRVVVRERPDVLAVLSAANRGALAADTVDDSGWTLTDLVAADLCGMTNRAYRERLQVLTPADLAAFLGRKYLVHLTCNDARVTRLAATAIAARLGHPVSIHDFVIKSNREAELTLLFPSATRLGTLFHYQIYRWGEHSTTALVGRHKLNGPLLYRGMASQ
ncbi:MAG: hypothetical protein HBSAPP03_15600 [Phycisphaerae bacterium]|nr:MAG: hypothetical protein HBSAPP03_15600 [Phycisphaerae bacterium]